MPKKQVIATASIGDSYLIDVQARHFSYKIDQPAPVGADSAPTPLDYFLFSLGGCMCTIGKTLADYRKIALRSIKVEINGDIDTDFLLGKTDEGRAGFTKIQMKVNIDADMTKAEKEAFVEEIEKRCPLADNVKEKSNIEVIVS
ncbi:MAG: OsmC family protein [Candidatus Cloacimonetes bacterium]|nr:OsmC family protein [Candidatus Cloacimonadota bacterium]